MYKLVLECISWFPGSVLQTIPVLLLLPMLWSWTMFLLLVFSLLKFLLCQLLLQNYWFPWIHLVAVLSNLHLSSLIYFWNSAEEFQDKWSFPAFPNTESINLFTFLQGSLFHATNFPASFLSFCSPINLHSMFSCISFSQVVVSNW